MINHPFSESCPLLYVDSESSQDYVTDYKLNMLHSKFCNGQKLN